jgi:uncharacterized protein
MKIEVAKVKENPIVLQETVEASSWDMDSSDVQFTGTIALECAFTRITKEILVDTVIKVNRVITCSRCLESVEQTDQQRFQLTYNSAALGENLEVDKDVREQVLLNFPMKVLCRPDCKGLCARCGNNLNTGKCTCKK